MKNLAVKILVAFVLLIPLWSFLAWFLWPSDRLESIVLDKSATPDSKEEHRSFNWILTHEKMYRPSGKEYDYSRDYYGTHREGDEGLVHGIDVYNLHEMDSMAFYIDLAYYIDARGVEMTVDSLQTSEGWYGGLSDKDYQLLKILFRDRKMIMAEYNTIASPTRESVRKKMEDLFELDFTGWVGRYFHSLDTAENEAIPLWLRQQYRNYYGKPFVFDNKAGIVLAHEDGKVVVLEGGDHLEVNTPVINTQLSFQQKLGVPNYVGYTNWFDITLSRKEENVFSRYKLHTNTAGDSLLNYFHIPNRFPAVIGDHEEGLRYYFCGDFADNDIMQYSAYFKGVELISKLFYLTEAQLRNRKFFWEFYRPMIKTILKEYLSRVPLTQRARALPEDSGYRDYEMVDTGMVLLPENGTRLDEIEELLGEPDDEAVEEINEAGEIATTKTTNSNVNWPGEFSSDRFRVGGRLAYREWLTKKESSSLSPTTTTVKESGTDTSLQQTGQEKTSSQNQVQRPDPGQKKWRIIIASLQSEERARDYVSQLGYSELDILYVDHLNTNRIAYGSYDNLRDAQIQFEEVVKRHPDAWMVLF